MGKRLLHDRGVRLAIVACLVLITSTAVLVWRPFATLANASANPVPPTLTDRLQRTQADHTRMRGETLRSAAAELQNFLATPESRTVTGHKDDRLPGVNLLLTPADRLRVVTLDGGPPVGSVNRAYNFIQWWNGDKQYVQELTGGAMLVRAAAVNVTSGAEKRLVLVTQVLQYPWTESVAVYRLNPASNRWTVLSDSFDNVKGEAGNTPIQVNRVSVSVPARGANAGAIFLKENGRVVQVCNNLRTVCEALTWNGEQFLGQ